MSMSKHGLKRCGSALALGIPWHSLAFLGSKISLVYSILSRHISDNFVAYHSPRDNMQG